MIYFADGGCMGSEFFSIEMLVLAAYHAGTVSFEEIKLLVALEDENNQ